MKHLFKEFIEADQERLHFAAHSHHPWPDCTSKAQEQYWRDSVAQADLKWGKTVFADIVPNLQQQIARVLNLSKPENIAFAPNTHEFVLRLLSCLPADRPARILTTDSEFYSFDRQMKRLEEDNLVHVTRIATQPFESFQQRFIDTIHTAEDDYDLIYFSQTFFNSGFVTPDLKQIVDAVPSPDTYIAIDGYHGFMALETDLSEIESRVFYLSGGYKYAMSGEGCCFIHVPEGYATRPRNTGWYAEFGALGKKKEGVTRYGADGMRFWGATFDPSGLYRMNAVLSMLENENINIGTIHDHVMRMQDLFLERLTELQSPRLTADMLLIPDDTQRGHFLTFKTSEAGTLQSLMEQHNIITDYRDDRLRFGFGIYHDEDMINALLKRLKEII